MAQEHGYSWRFLVGDRDDGLPDYVGAEHEHDDFLPAEREDTADGQGTTFRCPKCDDALLMSRPARRLILRLV